MHAPMQAPRNEGAEGGVGGWVPVLLILSVFKLIMYIYIHSTLYAFSPALCHPPVNRKGQFKGLPFSNHILGGKLDLFLSTGLVSSYNEAMSVVEKLWDVLLRFQARRLSV